MTSSLDTITLWHVAPASERTSIQMSGLLASIPVGALVPSGQPQGVYAWLDQRAALNFACATATSRGDMDLWELRVPADQALPDPAAPDGVYVPRKLDPDEITLVFTVNEDEIDDIYDEYVETFSGTRTPLPAPF